MSGNNSVIINGDKLQFDTKFGDKTVTPVGPAIILGTGKATINNQPICIQGDEKKVSVQATYFTSTYVTPGTGILTISSLADDQQAKFFTAETAVIVEGSQFNARFQPVSPARDPSQKPDPALSPVSGKGKFIKSQTFVTAG